MRPKLTLKDLKFVPKTEPLAPLPLPPRPMLVEQEPKPQRPGMPQAIWLELSPNWLRVVMDSRPNTGKRIFRVELYDKDRSHRLAVFRRQTEAMRQ